MSIKKKVRDYYNENIQCENRFDELREKLDLKPAVKKEFNYGGLFMKRKLLFGGSLCLVLLLVVGIVIAGLGGKKPTESDNVHLVELNVNPSIQFTVDEENKVLSVYGANDEGKMLINGEVFVGKDLDEAIELVIKLETEYGYLISGNVEATENKITVSVSSDIEDVVKGIKEDVNAAINAACEKYDVKKVIETANGHTLETLRALAMELDPTLTEEQVSKMGYQELLLVVENYHLEVVDYASVKLEELYQKIKNQKIEFAKTEAANEFIQKADSTYQEIKDKYLNLYNQIEQYVTTINTKLTEAYNEYFLDAESDYQKALTDLEKLKAEIAAIDQKLASEETNDLDKIILNGQKQALEVSYSSAKLLLESTETLAQTAINAVSTTLNSLVDSLKQLNEQLPTEIKTSMETAMVEVENDLNAKKDQLMTDFEAEYSEIIQQVKTSVENRKAEIKNVLAGTPA